MMAIYAISHLDGDGESFRVESETAGKAKYINYRDWSDVFSGTFKEYLERIIYCMRVKEETT